MPFGCLALRDGRTYDSISDVTDKYEIGQVLREFCELCLAKDRQTDKMFVCKKFLKKDGRKGQPPKHPSADRHVRDPERILYHPRTVSVSIAA
uniref:Uncharacterized protein n=1 Tax=Mastacembelus armatus TaxID=205130 RepID=A0A7N8XYT4_9TELE